MGPYRILVVDDSPFMRKIIGDLIEKDSEFVVAATASNGQEAVEAVQRWKPDAVTLDLEMPVMNGIEALQAIMGSNPTPVIMLSGISEDNTRDTINALQNGAFDFIRKPSIGVHNDIHQVGELLLEKLKIAVLAKRHQPVMKTPDTIAKHTRQHSADLSTKPRLPEHQKPSQLKRKAERLQDEKPLSPSAPSISHKAATSAVRKQKNEMAEVPVQKQKSPIFQHIAVIGTSTGGPRALNKVISELPRNFPAPILVVQHMPPKFTKSLAQRLDSTSSLIVVEAKQDERIYAGIVYIAPGGFHMGIKRVGSEYRIELSQQPPRNGHRPSVDVLFESVAECTGLVKHAVVLTGMGSDGTKGMQRLVECGAATTIAEAEHTCIVYGMPRSVIEAGYASEVVPLDQIAAQLERAVPNKS